MIGKTETPREQKTRLQKCNRYRDSVCQGCCHNYYNFPKPTNGIDVAVDSDYSCWHITSIKRGKCICHT